MSVSILVPDHARMVTVRASRTCGPPGLSIDGLPVAVSGRVRTSIEAGALELPSGRVELEVWPPPRSLGGFDLPFALAALLLPHRTSLPPGLAAYGGIAPDGTLEPCDAPSIGGLPPGPWIARFFDPVGRVPVEDDDAVVAVVDVSCLPAALECALRLGSIRV